MQIYADVTAAAAQRHLLRPGPGARLGHPRRGRGGRLPRRPGRRRGHGRQAGRRSTHPTRPAPTSTTSCTPSTCGCTTTSAGAATRSCTGCGTCGTACSPPNPGPANPVPRNPAMTTPRARRAASDDHRPARRPRGDQPAPAKGSVPCTPRSWRTTWSPGPRATSPPGCRRGPRRRRPDGDQAERHRVRRPDPRVHGRVRPRRPRRQEDGFSPSSDTATHAYVYRHMPEVGGVVHTHSTYATAWAARGEAVPCVITAMADEFGGEIPLGPFALIGSDEIGRGDREHPDRPPLPRRADAQPRGVHRRPRPRATRSRPR